MDTLLAENAGNTEMADNLRKELGLICRFILSFLIYIMNLLQGDFGQSVIDGEPVLDKIIAQFPATLMLTLASITISIVVGITLGVLAAIHQELLIMLHALSVY